MIGDKVGEVQYLAYDKLRAEGIKQLVVQPPNTEENEHEESSRVLFGQQQETLGLGLTRDGSTLIAIDTLNRIRISDFPNVFNIRHMILEHKK